MSEWRGEEGNWYDFHAVSTIQMGELIEDGFIQWDDGTWDFPRFSDEQHKRLCKKIEEQFWFREICATPPGKWKLFLLRKLRQVMPKYIPLYELVAEGLNPLQDSDTYGKRRNVFSDYPATRLGKNQDYASNADDTEFETVVLGNVLDKIGQVVRDYQDVDVLILQELEPCFYPLSTANVNVW